MGTEITLEQETAEEQENEEIPSVPEIVEKTPSVSETVVEIPSVPETTEQTPTVPEIVEETPAVPEIVEETTNEEGDKDEGNDENDTSDISASSLTKTIASSEKMTTENEHDDTNNDDSFFNLPFVASMVGVGTFVFLAGCFTIRRWENQDIASLTDGLKKRELGNYSKISQQAEDDYEGLDFHNDGNNAFYQDNDDEDLEHIELT